MSPEFLVAIGGFLLGLVVGRRWIVVAVGAALVGIWWSLSPIEGAGPWTLAVLGAGIFAAAGGFGELVRVKVLSEWDFAGRGS